MQREVPAKICSYPHKFCRDDMSCEFLYRHSSHHAFKPLCHPGITTTKGGEIPGTSSPNSNGRICSERSRLFCEGRDDMSGVFVFRHSSHHASKTLCHPGITTTKGGEIPGTPSPNSNGRICSERSRLKFVRILTNFAGMTCLVSFYLGIQATMLPKSFVIPGLRRR